MSVALPCNVDRKAVVAYRESSARGSPSGQISDMNVQAAGNASLELSRVRMSAPRRRVVFHTISVGHWSPHRSIHHVNDGNLIPRKHFNTCQPCHDCHPLTHPLVPILARAVEHFRTACQP